MYSICFIYDDIYDTMNFANFHEMMDFVVDLAKADTKCQFIIRNEKGETIYKYINLEKREEY